MAKLLHMPRNLYCRQRGYCCIKIDGLQFYCDSQHMNFWTNVHHGKWETQTLYILSTFLTPESIYCDIGAWIGPTVLHAAKRCKKVYCFEPDRVSYEYLLSNIRRNQLNNVIPFNLALTNRDGLTKIGTFAKSFGRSKSSLINGHMKGAMEVPEVSWSTAIRLFGPENIDFLKIDIEGAEYDLIPHLSVCLTNKKPKIYLSLHPQFLQKDVRVQKTKRLLESMQIYRNCYDSSLNKLSLDELLCPPYIDGCQEVLFTDED
ncbi:MAG: FkbM family methyltransferase [Nitrospirales bacterium]